MLFELCSLIAVIIFMANFLIMLSSENTKKIVRAGFIVVFLMLSFITDVVISCWKILDNINL